MLISVVIPTCHRNDLLAKCLDCLAPGTQTLQSDFFEVIVTDDGSSATAEAMITEKYPWVHWTQGPRRGPAANRNHGACLAQGDWIAFTDDDCLPKPFWLESFAEAICEEQHVYEGKTTCEGGFPTPLFTAPVNETGGFLWSCNMLINKALLGKLGGFDERFPFPAMEDVDLRERIKDTGTSLKFVPGAIVDHPARRVAGPVRLATVRESEYMFFARRGNPPKRFPWVWQILYVRLREIYRRPRGFEAVKAIPFAVVEAGLVAVKYPTWRRKYARETSKI